MRKKLMTRVIPTMVFVLIIMAGMTVAAHAMGTSQSQIYNNKIVVDIAPASNETIVSMDLYLNTNNNGYKKIQTLDPKDRQATISNLTPKNYYSVKIEYKYKFTGGSSNVYDGTGYLFDAKMLPVKVTSVKQDRWYYYIKQIDASWAKQESADGYKYEFYNWKGKKVTTQTVSGSYKTYANFKNIKNGKSYKMRVMAYTEFNGTKRWGPWSDYTHFIGQTPKFTAKFKKQKMTVKWKKVSGATSYTIMVSTKANKGYKAVKTVSAKKTKVTVKKFGKKKFKKGKKYYVYVRSNKKVGKKTFNSNSGGLPLYYTYVKCK